MTLYLALIGKDIGHSKSQKMYEKILGKNIKYDLIDCPNSESIPTIKSLLKKYTGVSITSPYKKHFLGSVKLPEEIKALGAINCIGKYEEEPFAHATNTDYLALREILSNKYLGKANRFVLLGDGTMAKVTVKVFKDLNISFEQYSRNTNANFSSLTFEKPITKNEKLLIINSCSRSYCFSGAIHSEAIFYDYNYTYKPHEQHFLGTKGVYIDGLELLSLQARHALKFWKVI